MSEQEPEIIIPGDNAGGAAVPARLNEVLPEQLLIVPLQARPFFPAQTMPVVLDEKLWRDTIERVGSTPHKLIGLVYARQYPDGEPPPLPEDVLDEVRRVEGRVGDLLAVSTAVDRSSVNRDQSAHLYVSLDGERWEHLARGPRDVPLDRRGFLQYPTFVLPTGGEPAPYLFASGQSIRGMHGRVLRWSVDEIRELLSPRI